MSTVNIGGRGVGGKTAAFRSAILSYCARYFPKDISLVASEVNVLSASPCAMYHLPVRYAWVATKGRGSICGDAVVGYAVFVVTVSIRIIHARMAGELVNAEIRLYLH